MLTLRKIGLVWWAAGILSVTGLATVLTPVHLPRHAPRFRSPVIDHRIPSIDPAALTRLAARFDLSTLPAERTPEPPPVDPTAALRAFTLIGIVGTDDTSVVLMAGGGAPSTLKIGEALAGFTLATVEARRVVFVQGATHVEFVLAEGTRTWLVQSQEEGKPPRDTGIQ
jgi:hypothetical protein